MNLGTTNFYFWYFSYPKPLAEEGVRAI